MGLTEIIYCTNHFFFAALKPKFSSGRPIFEVSISHRHTHTRTHSKTPLNVWSASRRGRYLDKTQQTQETNIHTLSGFRTRYPRNQATTDLPVSTVTGIGSSSHQNNLNLLAPELFFF